MKYYRKLINTLQIEMQKAIFNCNSNNSAIILSIIYIKEIRKLENPLGGLIFLGVLLVDVIIIVLLLTIFRGPEFPWNGTLFMR